MAVHIDNSHAVAAAAAVAVEEATKGTVSKNASWASRVHTTYLVVIRLLWLLRIAVVALRRPAKYSVSIETVDGFGPVIE
jgi:hypothetical protein